MKEMSEQNKAATPAKTESPQQAVAKKPSIDVTQVTDYFNATVFGQMKMMANAFVKSNALPKQDNEYTILMKLQGGYEMGMKPLEAIKSFYFVNGAMNIYGSATMRRLREHGWRINYEDAPNKCTVTIKKDDEEYQDTLTFEEAEQSGWVKDSYGKVKAGWREGANRKLKLRYGVTSMIIKTYVPEVLGSATDIAEVAMDYDIEPTGKVPVIGTDGSELASMDQVEALRKMGIENVPTELTKEQAIELMTNKKKREEFIKLNVAQEPENENQDA